MAERQTPDPSRNGDRRQAAPRESGDRRQTAPRESSDRRQTAPRESGDRRQAVPRESGDRRQTAPRESGDRRQAAPRESGDRRQTAPRESGDRRQTAPRESGDRRQAVPREGGDRRQAVPREGGDRRQAAPRESSDRRQGGDRRQTASRRSGERRQTPSRRNDVIRCENCGEDYSITYRRCPFCDERPGRGGIAGKRVANTRGGGYGRPASALRVTTWIISFAVILCAAFIVIRFMGAPIFGGKNPTGSNSSSSSGGSQGGGSSVSSQQPGGPDASGDTSAEPPAPGVEAVVLDTLDVTLDSGGTRQLVASLLPSGVEGTVTWTSSDPSVATVDASGLVTNVNAGNAQSSATITAACGAFTAQCTVYCNPKPAGTSVSGRQGTIVNADTGLNIRSGPGRDYDKVASAQNGSTVTILGEENGWYQIRYNGSNTGYVSKEFVSVG